jgi:hypothetical protein
MPRASTSPDPPLVCRRRFEPHRGQQPLWSAAYEQLVPQRRVGASATAPVRQRKEPVKRSGAIPGFLEGRSA